MIKRARLAGALEYATSEYSEYSQDGSLGTWCPGLLRVSNALVSTSWFDNLVITDRQTVSFWDNNNPATISMELNEDSSVILQQTRKVPNVPSQPSKSIFKVPRNTYKLGQGPVWHEEIKFSMDTAQSLGPQTACGLIWGHALDSSYGDHYSTLMATFWDRLASKYDDEMRFIMMKNININYGIWKKLRLCLTDEPIRGSRPCTVVEAHFQPGERPGFQDSRTGSGSQEGRPGGLETWRLQA